MKSLILFSLMGIIYSVPLMAQEFSPITMEKKGLAKHYIQNGERLDRKEIRSILSGYAGSAEGSLKSSRIRAWGWLGLVAGGCLVIGANSFIGTMKDLDALNSGSLDITGGGNGPF